MIETIYIEEEVRNHQRTAEVCNRFPGATLVYCDRYSNVFNNNSQNFRLQKQQPSLILARKYQKHVLPTPPNYGIGGSRNFYFSHMLNCLYDCRYCFLQGMYRSANYVLFVNYEDFLDQIEQTTAESSDDSWFFSGYDCDSLAMEPVTAFAETMLDKFESLPKAQLELRTKSTQIRFLLDREPIPNCVLAFSFTPNTIASALEHRVPDIEKRIAAMKKLQNQGWKIGLRFDPIIPTPALETDYRDLFQRIFASIEADKIHSVSYGMFRLPKPFFKKMLKLYPEEKLFAMPLTEQDTQVSVGESAEKRSIETVHRELLRFVDNSLIYPCS